ncbi:hypothetical protein ACIA8O_31305 [Kitasatospora sp. NPDC051853]|uniref:hypothetical protein n=1 Tax=Kitasatospora sp. NPDC051853 TaxID=3364058 RepID=UPI00379C5319
MEDPEFTVTVDRAPPSGTAPLLAVREITDLCLWQGRQLLDGPLPAPLLPPVPLDTALDAARRLRATGVEVSVDCTACHRTVPADGALLDPGPCAEQPWLITAHCRANSLTSCDCSFCADYGPLSGYTA